MQNRLRLGYRFGVLLALVSMLVGCLLQWTNYPHLTGSPTFTPWLVVKCQLSDVTNIPAGEDQTVAELFTQTAYPTGNLLDYFSDVSYGQISLEGSRLASANWVTTSYSSASGSNSGAAAGVSRAQVVQSCANQVSGISNLLSAYTPYGIVVALNSPLPNVGACYYGKTQLQIQGTNYPLACVLEGSDDLNMSFSGHEFGHAYGWNHSYDDSQQNCGGGGPGDYCDNFDIMSCLSCFTFNGNYPPGGPGANVPNLLYLRWLPADRISTYQVGQNPTSYPITALSHPLSAAPLTVKITGALRNTPNFYTVEYRKNDGWDQGLTQNCLGCNTGGVVIHEYNVVNSIICRSLLPNSCPAGQVYSYLQHDTGTFDCSTVDYGALESGCSWTDPTDVVKVTVDSIDYENSLATITVSGVGKGTTVPQGN